MNSPKDTFDEVWHHLRQGRGLSNTGDDPIYYLVFHPSRILEVKRLMPEWQAKLQRNGWKLETFSMADAVLETREESDVRRNAAVGSLYNCSRRNLTGDHGA